MPLYITEYSRLARASDGPFVASGQEPAVAEQKITVGGTTAQSAAFNAATTFVMVHADEVCHLAFGANPTAAATAHRIGLGETRFYGVSAGQKLAVITGA